MKLRADLEDEYHYNIRTSDDSYLANSYMYQKKLIFLTNFVSADILAIPVGRQSDVFGILALKSDDFFTSKSLFVINNGDTIWTLKLVFDANGIDRLVSTNGAGIVPKNDQYCTNFANSKAFLFLNLSIFRPFFRYILISRVIFTDANRAFYRSRTNRSRISNDHL